MAQADKFRSILVLRVAEKRRMTWKRRSFLKTPEYCVLTMLALTRDISCAFQKILLVRTQS